VASDVDAVAESAAGAVVSVVRLPYQGWTCATACAWRWPFGRAWRRGDPA